MPAIDDHEHLPGPPPPGRPDQSGQSGSFGQSGPFGPAARDELAGIADFDAFLRVSAELTGFDETELRATGMAHEHHRTLLAHRVRDEHALLHLWYVGAWPDEPPTSPRAHDQGLLWRTFHGAAPGSTAPGHGSWSEAPQLGGDR
ncbi:hypothetical protein [Kitasatospora sp. NPDC093806]|uniref:hypothetical protein n=1 Tax=Kitasatospora sp. NPDC093806 TaxID=3155075 RepID=UPI0034360FD6